MKDNSIVLKVVAILWLIWGLVHILAGIMTMKGILTGDIASSVAGIADAIAPDTLQSNYHAAAGAIIGQHGFNLFWVGLTTFGASFFVWKGNKHAIFLAALVGGFADLGYFLFLDLGGFVNFVPGTIMTIISASAIVLSVYHFYSSPKHT